MKEKIGRMGNVLLLIFLFCFSAFGVTVSIPDINVPAGTQSINVPVEIDDASGIAGFQFSITYDNSVLGLPNENIVSTGTLTSGWTIMANTQTPGEIKIGGFNPSLSAISGGQGSLCVIRFNVIGSAGMHSDLNIIESKLSDVNGVQIAHSRRNGRINIVQNPAKITGRIVYTGTKTGLIYIALFTQPDIEAEPVKYTTIQNPGPYEISDIPPGVYYVYAMRDANNNGQFNPDTDPGGAYSGNPITLQAGETKTGIDITLLDPIEFVIDKTSITVPEGGSSTFNVKLSRQPSGNVNVSLTVTGDPDITVSPSGLTFTPTNWNTYQTVTVSAAEDDDIVNGTATITLSATGIQSRTIQVTEQDNDLPPAPILSVEPTKILFATYESGEEFKKRITIRNIGLEGLTWEAIKEVEWIEMEPVSGGPLGRNESQEVEIIRINGKPGDSAKIIFKNTSEGSTQQDIEVIVKINKCPKIESIEIYPPKDLNDIVKPETFVVVSVKFEDDDKVTEYRWSLFEDRTEIDTGAEFKEDGIEKTTIIFPFALFDKDKTYKFEIICKDNIGEESEKESIEFKVQNKDEIPIGILDVQNPVWTKGKNERIEIINPTGMLVGILRQIDPGKIEGTEAMDVVNGLMFDIRITGIAPGSEVELRFEVLGNVNRVFKYQRDGWVLFSNANFSPGSVPGTTIIGLILRDGRTPDDYDRKENGIIVDPLAFSYVEEGPAQVSGGGGCFIATACFGNYNHPIVKILREFRDRFLLTNIIGKTFVRWYYSHSPKYAEIISKSSILRGIVRLLLIPFVIFAYLCIKGLILPLILVSLSLILFRRKSIKKVLPILIFFLVLSSNLFAQDINLFKLMPGEKYTITSPTRFLVEKGKFEVDFVYSYADKVLEGIVGGVNKDIITSQNLLQLGLTYGFTDKFNISLLIPYLADQDVLQGQKYKDSGFGDLYLIGKYKIWDGGRECFGIVLIPFIGFNTGKEEALISADSIVYGLKISFDKYLTDKLITGFNVGYSHQSERKIGQIEIDNSFLFGAGLIYLFSEKMHISGEIIGRSDDGFFKEREKYPIEGIISFGYNFKNCQFILGAGTGIVDGYGASSWRLFTGIKGGF